MNEYMILRNTKNKPVSACFIDNKAFNALIDGLNNEELVKVFHALEKSAEITIQEERKNMNKALNTVARFTNSNGEPKKGSESIVSRAQAKADKCHGTIVNLEKDNSWWVTLQERIILKLGEEEEE